MTRVRLLSLSGSQRAGSMNQLLVDRASELAREAGADVTQIHLKDFALPVYTPDVEAEAFPEGARELKALFKAHQGFLIASPEYNGSVSGGLKNALDWASRPTDGEGPLAFTAFRGKIGGIMSASPGPLGGARGLQHLGQILATMHALVVTEQVMVPFADQAIAANALYDGFPAMLLPPLVQRVIRLAGAAL